MIPVKPRHEAPEVKGSRELLWLARTAEGAMVATLVYFFLCAVIGIDPLFWLK
jgi:hypothetical protein